MIRLLGTPLFSFFGIACWADGEFLQDLPLKNWYPLRDEYLDKLL